KQSITRMSKLAQPFNIRATWFRRTLYSAWTRRERRMRAIVKKGVRGAPARVAATSLLLFGGLACTPARQQSPALQRSSRSAEDSAEAMAGVQCMPTLDHTPITSSSSDTPSRQQLAALAGMYTLVMIEHGDGRPDSTVRGTLSLRRVTLAPTIWHLPPAHQPDVVLTGYTDVPAGNFGNIVVPATSEDTLTPGVQVTARGNYNLVIGDPFTSRGVTLDAGLLLDIGQITDSTFSGRWVSGANVVPLPHGYYCAVRKAS